MFEKLEELAKNNKKISDFHIRAGAPLAYRQTGEIIKVQEVMVTAQDIKDLLSMNCNEHELNKFDKTLFAAMQNVFISKSITAAGNNATFEKQLNLPPISLL